MTPNAQIELFVLTDYRLTPRDAYDPEEEFPDEIRFCNFTGVRWRETPDAEPKDYLAIGCESEGYDLTGQGALPQPRVTVSNVGRMLANVLYRLKYNPLYRLEGGTLIRHLTQVNFLEDGPDYLSPARELPRQIYTIEQLEGETESAAQFILTSSFELDGVTLPGRMALRTCPYRYREEDTCGYTGTAMFTRANQPTGNAAQDICAKTLTACELRHAGLLPFGGYVGLGGF